MNRFLFLRDKRKADYLVFVRSGQRHLGMIGRRWDAGGPTEGHWVIVCGSSDRGRFRTRQEAAEMLLAAIGVSA